MATITIEVDENVKTAFEAATAETRQQLSSIIKLFFRENLHEKTLTEVMAEIGDRARQRGLTPEILQEILAEDIAILNDCYHFELQKIKRGVGQSIQT